MSDQPIDTEIVVCRLCMSTDPCQLEIFGDCVNNRLSHKIKRCLPIQVHIEDNLTKSICQTCITKVEDIFTYQQLCINTQVALEKERLKLLPISKIPEDDSIQDGNIDKHLRGGCFVATVLPIGSKEGKDLEECKSTYGPVSALPISSVVHNMGNNGNDAVLHDLSSTLPLIKNPCVKDYTLVKENVFEIEPNCSITSKHDALEFRGINEDFDMFETQQGMRTVLPPMWDVYERCTNSGRVVHRRYILSESSFPCALCASCVQFYHPKSQHLERKSSSKLENVMELPSVNSELQADARSTPSELGNEREQNCVQDIGSSQWCEDGGLLDCPECGKSFPRRSSLKRHVRSHFEGRAFVCSLCEKGFNRKEHLSRHMMSHSGGRPFHCDSCSKTFSRREHLARHHASNPRCAMVCKSSLDPEIAKTKHFSCSICSQSFLHREHMLRHLKRIHLVVDGSDASECCNVCNRSFSEKRKLQEHFRSCHKKLSSSPHETNSNLDSTLSDSGREGGPDSFEPIEVEVNLVEDEFDDQKCDISPKINEKLRQAHFPSLTEPFQHKHEDDSPKTKMDKDLCTTQTESKSCIIPSTFCCEFCQKQFCNKSHLSHHSRLCHPYTTLDNGACEMEEEKDSTQVNSLSILSNRLDEEVDDHCEVFLSSVLSNPTNSTLYSKSSQHLCSICGKTFGRRYHLVRHRRTQHGVESLKSDPLLRLPMQAYSATSSTASQLIHCTSCSKNFHDVGHYSLHLCERKKSSMGLQSKNRAFADMASTVSSKLHKAPENFDVVCRDCSMKFDNKSELDKHMETHINGSLEGMLWV